MVRLDASVTWDLVWLDFHLTGWFEFIENGAPYRAKLGTSGRKRFLSNARTKLRALTPYRWRLEMGIETLLREHCESEVSSDLW